MGQHAGTICENITSSLEMYVLDNGCIVLGSGYSGYIAV